MESARLWFARQTSSREKLSPLFLFINSALLSDIKQRGDALKIESSVAARDRPTDRGKNFYWRSRELSSSLSSRQRSRSPSIEISRWESRPVIVPLWRVVVNRASLSRLPFGLEGAPSNRNQATSSINLKFRRRGYAHSDELKQESRKGNACIYRVSVCSVHCRCLLGKAKSIPDFLRKSTSIRTTIN